MHEPADIDLDKPGGSDPDDDLMPRRSVPIVPIVVAVVLLLALAGGYLYLRRTPSPAPAPAATAKPSAPVETREPGEEITLPPLDESDPIVRELVGRLSSYPAVTAWLTTEGLLLNFVAVTSRIARGEIATGELKALGTIPPFRPVEKQGTIRVDPASYQRYNAFVEAVAALDARGTARLYSTLEPRIREAYTRQGGQGADFDPVLERAIIEMLKVPIVEGNVELVPTGIVYGYADERLEGLSSAQKQLLRMGPQNVRRVQEKLREIADYLAIPASRLPPRS
jgi:hypothetical protein